MGTLPPGLQVCGGLRAPGRGAGGQPGHSEPRAGALCCATLWGADEGQPRFCQEQVPY